MSNGKDLPVSERETNFTNKGSKNIFNFSYLGQHFRKINTKNKQKNFNEQWTENSLRFPNLKSRFSHWKYKNVRANS